MESIFFEITIIICLTAVLAIVFRLLKQPVLLAYILAGIIIGPFGKLQLHNAETLQAMGEFGVALLLFILGLEFKLKELKSVGKQALLIGLFQICITWALGFGIALSIGFTIIVSLLVGLSLAFSSTIAIVSILSDKREINSLHGKITVGILLVQDIAAIVLLVFLPKLHDITDVSSYAGLLLPVMVKAIVLTGVIFFLSKIILPKILHGIASSIDILFLFSLAWVLGVAALTSSSLIGFPIAIGGFLAGVSLANATESLQIAAKVRTLRDFFLIIFFVTLGMQMSFDFVLDNFFPLVVVILFVMVIKPFIVLVLVGLFGYKKRTAFLAAITTGQISEFSLIVVFLGLKLGYISPEVSSFMAVVSMVTFITSTYVMTHSKKIYPYIDRYIGFVEKSHALEKKTEPIKDHIVLIGARGIGESILKAAQEGKEDVLVVDFNPDVIAILKEKGIKHVFGDISDLEIQESASVHHAKLIISTVPEKESNLLLIDGFKRKKGEGILIAIADNRHDAKALYKKGADYVVLPDVIGGVHIAQLIKDDMKNVREKIEKMKDKNNELFFF